MTQFITRWCVCGLAMALLGSLQAAPLRILVIGSTNSYSTSLEAAFLPNALGTNLQQIIAGDANITQGVSVVVQTINTNNTVSTLIGQTGTSYQVPYQLFSLAQYYYWPDQRTNRLALLQQGWDYVVLMDDPYVVARQPGFYVEGVRKLAATVSAAGSKPLLLMQWPSTGATDTVGQFGEVTYRVGDGCNVPVVPAGYAWGTVVSNYPALVDTNSAATQPTPNGSYLAAATIYSTLFNRSAKVSSSPPPSGMTTTQRDTLADVALNTVQAQVGATHYSGQYTNQNYPMGFCGNHKRRISYANIGSSSEGGISDGLGAVIPQANVMVVSASGQADFLEGRLGQYYVVNTNSYQRSFGFDLQDNNGGLSMLYGIDTGYYNPWYSDLGGAQTVSGDVAPYGSRFVPQKLLFTELRYAAPGMQMYWDGWHLYGPMNECSGAFIYTLLSGRCPVGDQPASDPRNSAWQNWLGRKVGYETAWRMASLSARVPGFEVLPSSATATNIPLGTAQSLTVRFLYPPVTNVTVLVSFDATNSAVLNPSTLLLTPQNYNTRQTVTLQTLPGVLTSEAATVRLSTASSDVAFNGLYDEWAYTLTRAQTQSVTVSNAGAQTVATTQDGPVLFSLNAPAASAGNTTFIGPVNGSVAWQGSQVNYSPNYHFSGTDSLTYFCTNGGTISVGSVTVTISNFYLPPQISLISPSSGTTLPAPAQFSLASSGSWQGNGTISYYANNTLIATVTNAPLNAPASWLTGTSGTYSLQAVVQDGFGGSATSSVVSVSVSAPTNADWWTPASGNWSGGTNWLLSQIADGGLQASFAQMDITNIATVLLDSPRSVSGMAFGDANLVLPNWLIGSDQYGSPVVNPNGPQPVGWVVDNGGINANNLTMTGSAPGIYVADLGGGLTNPPTPSYVVQIGAGTYPPAPSLQAYRATVRASLSGSSQILKTGPGELVLATNNDFTGGFNIQSGIVTLSANAASGFGPIQLSAGATLRCDDITGLTVTIPNDITLTGSSSATFLLGPGNGSTANFNGQIIGTNANAASALQLGYTAPYSATVNGCALNMRGNILMGNRTISFICNQGMTNSILGGTVTAGQLTLGRPYLVIGGNANVVVSGTVAGSDAWETITLQDQASLQADTLSQSANPNPIWLNSGTLTVNRIVRDRSDLGPINFNGTRVRANSTTGNFLQGASPMTIAAGGALLDTLVNDVTVTNSFTNGVSSDGGLAKFGTGALHLAAGSSFNGPVRIEAGTLEAQVATALGNSVSAGVYPTAVLRLPVNSALSNGASLYLLGNGSVDTGSSASTRNVKALYLNGVPQAAGTWGAAGSGATYIDSHFAGSGTVTVATKPSTTNLPPTAAAISVKFGPAGGIINVLLSCSDPNSDPLYVEGATTPANGTALVSGNLVYYTPNSGFTGGDSFQYVVGDGRSGFATNTITLVVSSAQLTWDADATTAGIQDGNGSWTGTATNWWNGSNDVTWTNGADATFGASGGGVVTVSGLVPVVNSLNFQQSYALTGSRIDLGGLPTSVTVASGKTGFIASSLTNGGINMQGPGNLVLSNANSLPQGLILGASKVVAALSGAVGGPVTFSGGSLSFAGSDTTHVVSQPLWLNTAAPTIALETNNLTVVFSGNISNNYSSAGTFNIGETGSFSLGTGKFMFANNQVNLGNDSLSVNGWNVSGVFVVSNCNLTTSGNITGSQLSGVGITINGTSVVSAASGYIGGSSPNFYLNIADQAQLTAASAYFAGSGSCTMSLNGGGMTVGAIQFNKKSTLNLNGGVLRAGLGASNNFVVIPTNTILNVQNGGAFIDTQTNSITLAAGLTNGGSGGLTKLGTGLLTLTATNTYVGNTTTSNGTLALSCPAGAVSLVSNSPALSVSGGAVLDVGAVASGFHVLNGQTLSGLGSVKGGITVDAGGVLTVGGTSGTPGTITFSNNLTLGGTTRLRLNKGGRPTCDLVQLGSGALTCGGSLVISSVGGTLAGGDSFKLFNAGSYAGGFGSLSLPALGTGLSWNTNQLMTAGVLAVVPPYSTTPTNLTYAMTATNSLVLNWPADHIGWRLQYQSNSLATGLGKNWINWPGSTATNIVVVPIGVDLYSVFFRLVFP